MSLTTLIMFAKRADAVLFKLWSLHLRPVDLSSQFSGQGPEHLKRS